MKGEGEKIVCNRKKVWNLQMQNKATLRHKIEASICIQRIRRGQVKRILVISSNVLSTTIRPMSHYKPEHSW